MSRRRWCENSSQAWIFRCSNREGKLTLTATRLGKAWVFSCGRKRTHGASLTPRTQCEGYDCRIQAYHLDYFA